MQKGMWGGRSVVNNRKLSAEVRPMAKGIYKITLRVESINVVKFPLDDNDVILFALHDTWDPFYRLINVENGKAELELYSYGSFTVGALVDKGNTELELDLGDLPAVAEEFIIN